MTTLVRALVDIVADALIALQSVVFRHVMVPIIEYILLVVLAWRSGNYPTAVVVSSPLIALVMVTMLAIFAPYIARRRRRRR